MLLIYELILQIFLGLFNEDHICLICYYY